MSFDLLPWLGEVGLDETKRETCKWAERPEHFKKYPALDGRSNCTHPIPASFPAINVDWLITDDKICARCPCWQKKDDHA